MMRIIRCASTERYMQQEHMVGRFSPGNTADEHRTAVNNPRVNAVLPFSVLGVLCFLCSSVVSL